MTITPDRLTVPETLQPESAYSMLPAPSVDDLRALKAAGWSRMGVIAAIFDRAGNVLMLEHKGAEKTPDGALGPLAETSQIARFPWGSIVVESAAHTLSRGIHEELGVDDPSAIELRSKRYGGWTLSPWPVGVSNNGEQAIAICPVATIDDETKSMLLDGFAENEEIKRIAFMTPDDVRVSMTRPGTDRWLTNVMSSGLIAVRHADLAPVLLPEPYPLNGGVDIKMNELGYL